MSVIRVTAAAMIVAWLGCLALSERPYDDTLKDDDKVGRVKRDDGVNLTDFDPLEAKPAGVIRQRNHKGAVRKKPVLPPEGSQAVDRLCKISADPSGWVLLRFPAEGKRKAIRPRWALPNKTLETLEGIYAKNPDVMFRITGEMTIYRDNSFMLIRRAGVVEPDEPVHVTEVATVPDTKPVPKTKDASATSQPKTSTQPKSKPAAGPSSADLMRAMLAEKNPTPIIIPTRKKKVSAAAVKSVAPGAKGDIIEPATARLIVDRLMTIHKTNIAQWRQATFEADNTLREPPVTLLPSTLLQDAEKQPSNRRLRVTGEITNYKGKRFMLLRKVIVERVMNRL